jgi:UPF0176 protein
VDAKVLLYYLFTPVPDPETVMHWQRELCERLGLRGRIIVADHGINGTVGGDLRACKKYVRAMNAHPRFAGIEFKWSEGTGSDFPRLSVKVRPELVTLAPEESFDVFDSGVGLRPREWDSLLRERSDLVILDARNDYDHEIGRFDGAVTPPIRAFKEIKGVLAEMDRSTPVATYCTGDVRCEYLSAYMRHLGFEEVYHLDGGIVKYGETFRDEGLWRGSCYVFDERTRVAFSSDSLDVGQCRVCDNATSEQQNCANPSCHAKVVVCASCQEQHPVGAATCDRCAEAT